MRLLSYILSEMYKIYHKMILGTVIYDHAVLYCQICSCTLHYYNLTEQDLSTLRICGCCNVRKIVVFDYNYNNNIRQTHEI